MLLHGWFIKPRSGKILGTILHFHGNAGNVGYYLPVIMPLVKAGFQCLVWDYQQYGTSQGIASQEHVLEDGLAALDYIKSREDVKGTKLILFGQSLGGHLAMVVAAKEQRKLHALVVEGAFTGHHEIAAYHGWRSYLAPPPLTFFVVPSKYEARKVVNQITIPKLFIHSTEDKTCPYFMGRKLYDKAIAPKEFWEIKGRHCRAALLYTDEFVAHFVKLVQ
jgi:pimeloyl-ACP methyl ester carboxylesterase